MDPDDHTALIAEAVGRLSRRWDNAHVPFGGSGWPDFRYWLELELQAAFNHRKVAALAAEDGELLARVGALLPKMLEALPWGAYKAALMEDHDLKAAMRAAAPTAGREEG
jgi:hypothetical protein